MSYVEGGKSILIGIYSPTDKRGIDYLNSQAREWGILTGCYVALSIVAGIAAVLSGIPTVGVGALVLGSLAVLCGLMAGVCWGNMAAANNAMVDALHYAQQGKTVSIYRNTGLFGITTGYAVRA